MTVDNKHGGSVAVVHRVPTWALSLLLCIIGLIAYGHTLDAPFYLDDYPNIEANIGFHNDGSLLDGVRRVLTESPIRSRPTANLSFALNYHLAGLEVSGYHLVNIALHLISGLLVFWVVFLTLDLPSIQGQYPNRRAIAFFVALLWLVNPLQTQTVTYIVQRMNGMAVMFYLLALALYLKGRLSAGSKRRLLVAAAIGSWLLALGSKEIAITLPLLALLYEWYFFQDLNPNWLRRHLPLLLLALGLCAAATVAYLGWPPWKQLMADYATRDFTLEQRLLTESRIVLDYLSQLLYPNPQRLALEHDIRLSTSLVDPPLTVVAIITIAILIFTALTLARTQRLLSFCILWYFGHLLLESSLIPLELVFEHRTYLPSVGVLLLTVTLLFRLPWPRLLPYTVLGITALLWTYWTYQRNDTWRDELVFWQDNVAKFPNNPRSLCALGLILDELGHYPDAERRFQQTVAHFFRQPSFTAAEQAKIALINLGIMRYRTGRYSEAIEFYDQALAIKQDAIKAIGNRANARAAAGDPAGALADYSRVIELHEMDSLVAKGSLLAAQAYNGRAKIRARHGELQGAMDDYDAALRNDPSLAVVYSNRATLLYAQQRREAALENLDRALALAPDNAPAHAQRGVLFLDDGNLANALIELDTAIELNPSLASAYRDRGRLRLQQGRLPLALMDFDRAIIEGADDADVYYYRARTRTELGDLSDAVADYGRTIERNPSLADAYGNRGNLRRRLGDWAAALEDYESVLAIRPRDPLAYVGLGTLQQILGNNIKASEYFKQALAIAPDNWPQIARVKALLMQTTTQHSNSTHQDN